MSSQEGQKKKPLECHIQTLSFGRGTPYLK